MQKKMTGALALTLLVSAHGALGMRVIKKYSGDVIKNTFSFGIGTGLGYLLKPTKTVEVEKYSDKKIEGTFKLANLKYEKEVKDDAGKVTRKKSEMPSDIFTLLKKAGFKEGEEKGDQKASKEIQKISKKLVAFEKKYTGLSNTILGILGSTGELNVNRLSKLLIANAVVQRDYTKNSEITEHGEFKKLFEKNKALTGQNLKLKSELEEASETKKV